jgi:hypothetical protein
MQGEQHEIDVWCCDSSTTNNNLATDPEELHFLEILRNTEVNCGECLMGCDCGNYPKIIVMSIAEDAPPPPDGMVFVGPVYDFTGYSNQNMKEGSECESVIFGKQVALLLDYDPYDLPDDAVSVTMAYYNVETGLWELLPPDPGRVAEVGQITGLATHMSLFSVLATLPSASPPEPPEPPPPPEPVPPEPPPPPASFTASGLDIIPSEETVGSGQYFIFVRRVGEKATVTADIANNGGQKGTYTADLKINGRVYETREITLDTGSAETLVFTIAGLEPGRYTVELAGLNGEFQTSVWYNGWLIAGIATGIGLLCWLAWYFGYHRKRKA